ncbi:MAG TPA: hypothetical protein VLW85_09960 [Myxococcales bacterium]|nr:hypothetical protein [Myxococcales bacterium]
MTPKLAILSVLLSVACAAHVRQASTANKMVMYEKSPGMFVGHTDEGEVVVAASHYDAMNGLAVMDTDLGLEKRKDGSGAMLCRREVPTGSHVPHWMCRYTEDMEHERQLTLNELQRPFLSPSVNTGAGGASGASGMGSVGRTQQR